MKKRVICLAGFVCIFLSSISLATPSPNIWWNRGDNNTTWQEWSFTTDENPALPEAYFNPYGTPWMNVDAGGVAHGFEPGWYEYWHGREGVWHGETVDLTIRIDNNPVTNEYKEIWLEVGFEGDFVSADTIGIFPIYGILIDQEITNTPDGWHILNIGWRLEPNPPDEYIWLSFENSGSSIDYITVDTICIPEPATIALFVLGGTMLIRNKQKRQ